MLICYVEWNLLQNMLGETTINPRDKHEVTTLLHSTGLRDIRTAVYVLPNII